MTPSRHSTSLIKHIGRQLGCSLWGASNSFYFAARQVVEYSPMRVQCWDVEAVVAALEMEWLEPLISLCAWKAAPRPLLYARSLLESCGGLWCCQGAPARGGAPPRARGSKARLHIVGTSISQSRRSSLCQVAQAQRGRSTLTTVRVAVENAETSKWAINGLCCHMSGSVMART